jgi:hypothetical protein
MMPQAYPLAFSDKAAIPQTNTANMCGFCACPAAYCYLFVLFLQIGDNLQKNSGLFKHKHFTGKNLHLAN